MKKHIILLVFILASMPASADLNLEFEHYGWISVASKHTATDVKYEEFNPGLGIQSFLKDTPIFFAAGVFDNSFDSSHSKEDFGKTSDITFFIGGGLEYQGEYIGPGYIVGLAKGYPLPYFITPYLRLGSREWIVQTQLVALPLNLVDESQPNIFGLSFTVNLGELF